MNVTKVLQGSHGFEAQGFALSALLGQAQFLLGQGINRETNPNTQKPTFDTAVAEAMGDNGLPEPKKLDTDQLTDACAAGFVLMVRHVKTPNPETGKTPAFRARFCRDIKAIVQRSVDYVVQRQVAASAANAAAMEKTLGKPIDSTKRIASIRAEVEKRWTAEVIGPYQAKFIAAIKEHNGEDNDELYDVLLEALADNDEPGRTPAKLVKAAARAFIESRAKAFEQTGAYVNIDMGIFALANDENVPVAANEGVVEAPEAA